ncbi:MAG: hypothetical protein A2176_08965 [Spirochaetes bacterium RBG_13_51_14]|nr:MAG: hypothetical protein A2176_08965 [Spirochaetes bacterium RBG_13_51_14]
MKKMLFIVCMIVIGTVLFADEIYLSDGTVLKGKIIQITDTEVEYDPAGDRAFDVVEKSDVVKIVYDSGQIVNYKLDTLYRADGTVVKGTIIRVTMNDITYSPEGSAEQKTVPRGEIVRIQYSDGKEIDVSKKKEGGEGEAFEEKKQTGGFLDSWVRIAGFFAYGTPSSGVFDKERRVLNAYKADLLRAYVLPRDYQMYNMFGSGGAELDFMPPAIKFVQRRAFDFTGIKFGIRGRYGFEYVDSVIVDESSYYDSVESYEMFRGRLMSYHYWGAGPVMNLILSPRSNLFNFIINFYVLGGQIFDGNIRAAAALRSARFLAFELLGVAGPYGVAPLLPASIANVTNTRYFNTARFTGYTIRCGFGPHFSLNRYFPITFGVNITYAYSNLKLGRALPIYYDGNKRAAHHEVGGEVTAGVHF